MDAIERAAVLAALRKMVSDGWFSICVIDKILKMTETVPDRRAYDVLSLLHCVNFRDMSEELRRELPALLSDCLGGVEFTLDLPVDAPRRRLFGWGSR